MKRRDTNTLTLDAPFPVTVFANEDVQVEPEAIRELESTIQVHETAREMYTKHPDWFDDEPRVEAVAVTPDFHKGAGIPIGTVIRTHGFLVPQASGNDINCGMCLYRTDLTSDAVLARKSELVKRIRHLFFEGGRQIPMTRMQREALLKFGVPGLVQTNTGAWNGFDAHQREDLTRLNGGGSLDTHNVFGLDDFLGTDKPSYDSQIGSVGKGNHFVEIQRVAKIVDARLAYQWGLRPDQIVVMIHSGSVSIGHLTGGYFKDLVRKMYPTDMKHPENGLFVLPDSERFRPYRDAFWTSFSNAANFAYGNRLFLGLMMFQALHEEAKCGVFRLVYGSGHNLIWKEDSGTWLHRKGACTAQGPEQLVGTPFEYDGEPVIIPGSMGTRSYLLVGLGNEASLLSASHGAGRALSRGKAMKASEDPLAGLTVVTPVDPDRPEFKRRPDILRKWRQEMGQEAPGAYKDIGPVIKTQVDAGLARVVVEMEPLLTVKA